MGWGRNGGGTASTSPRNAANLSRSLLVGHWEGWRRALHWQADEDTCLLPASPSGLHRTALASVEAPENRQPTPGNAACHLISQKKTILQALQKPVARLSSCVKLLRTPPQRLNRCASLRASERSAKMQKRSSDV